jgi:hypothetical protein
MRAYQCDLRGMAGKPLIDTPAAEVERVHEHLVEVRFKPGSRLDAPAIAAVMEAKQRLCVEGGLDVLATLPPDMDYDTRALLMDHHRINGGCGCSRRLAMAAGSAFNQRLANIYFRYHPREHETAVFVAEEDARAWLSGSPTLSLY